MSLDNRHFKVQANGIIPVIRKLSTDVFKIVMDAADWSPDGVISSASADSVSALSGDAGVAPTMGAYATTTETCSITATDGAVGSKKRHSTLLTFDNGDIKKVEYDIHVIADPAADVAAQDNNLLDNRVVKVGQAGTVPLFIKHSSEAYKVTFDLTEWNKDNATTIDSVAAWTANVALNAPTLTNTVVDGANTFKALIAAGGVAYNANAAATFTTLVTMNNGEKKKLVVAIKITG